MDRRSFLMAITSTTAVGAGCSTPLMFSEPTSLEAPTVDNPDEGMYYYNFAYEGDLAANVDVIIEPRTTPSERAGILLSGGRNLGGRPPRFGSPS